MRWLDRALRTRFFSQNPSPGFVWWIRRVLFCAWIGLLVLDGPSDARRFSEIRAGLPPGPPRNAAMRKLAAEAIGELVVFPVLMIGMLGYGVAFDRTAAVAGGRWFYPSWKVSPKAKTRKDQSDDDPRDTRA